MRVQKPELLATHTQQRIISLKQPCQEDDDTEPVRMPGRESESRKLRRGDKDAGTPHVALANPEKVLYALKVYLVYPEQTPCWVLVIMTISKHHDIEASKPALGSC